jgi:ubiquitin conjugation factor E4 B
MINDVTYLMDESLSELTQIHNIQVEMDDKAAWEAKPAEYRREREGTLRSLERHASGYTTLGRSTVELLKIFTAETKAPFMMPEIVDRLAAMLDYNLQALVGPKYQDLRVREPEKLKFNPRVLLSDILQVFLNLSDQKEFIQSVAGDGRSYSKELFDKAEEIALRRNLKTQEEVAKLHAFVEKVEEAKASLEAEEDLGEVPDEFLGAHVSVFPNMHTITHDLNRSAHVHCHERPSLATIIQNHSRPSYHQIPLTVRFQRSF